MFEISPIGTSAKFKPFKESESEIPSVELITELVEVKLEKLSFYVMVGIKDASFGVADGNMHPRQDLSHFLLVIPDDGLPPPRPSQGRRRCWHHPSWHSPFHPSPV